MCHTYSPAQQQWHDGKFWAWRQSFMHLSVSKKHSSIGIYYIVQKLAQTQTTFENFNSKYLSLWRLLTKYKTKHYWSYAVWHPLRDITKKISVYEIDNDQCDSQSNKESSWTTSLSLLSILYLQYGFSTHFPDVPQKSLCMLYLNDNCSGYIGTAAKQTVGVAGSRQNTVLGENDRKAIEDVVGRTRVRGLSISMRDRRQPTQNCRGSNPFVLLTSFLH
jgi:hypothetical protein